MSDRLEKLEELERAVRAWEKSPSNWTYRKVREALKALEDAN